jgi:hypothetical protein
MKRGKYHHVLAGVLGAAGALFGDFDVEIAEAQVNSWTNTAGGRWEIRANWSAGVLPTNNASVFITNATTKTVTIDATTVLSNALNNCMTISNLMMQATGPNFNTLQLTGAGTNTPLRILNEVAINSGGVLLVTNSVLRVDGLTGGSLAVDGNVWVTGGQLVTTNASAFIGFNGVGQMAVSNGTWLGGTVVLSEAPGSQGALTFAGGTNTLSRLTLGDDANALGTVWLTGGLLVVSNDTSIGANAGNGAMTISNGTWLAQQVSVTGCDQSVLTVAGGTSSVFSNLTIGGDQPCVCDTYVFVTGGTLAVTNAATNAVLEIRQTALALNGGTLRVDRFVMTNSCAQFGRTGGTLIYGTAVLDPNRDDDGDGISNSYEQSHGLDPLNSADANVDNDGDGQTNLQEFQAGTDATNSASAFRITAIVKTNNDLRVTWMTGTGKTNALERSTGTSNGSYSNNFAAIFTATNTTGTTTNFLDVGAATNAPAFYYRVRLLP